MLEVCSFSSLLIGQSLTVLASDWLTTCRQCVTLAKVTLPVIASHCHLTPSQWEPSVQVTWPMLTNERPGQHMRESSVRCWEDEACLIEKMYDLLFFALRGRLCVFKNFFQEVPFTNFFSIIQYLLLLENLIFFLRALLYWTIWSHLRSKLIWPMTSIKHITVKNKYYTLSLTRKLFFIFLFLRKREEFPRGRHRWRRDFYRQKGIDMQLATSSST